METELRRLNAMIQAMKQKIETTRWIIEKCKQQQLAEAREQIILERRSYLMEKVAQTEIKLQEALKHRQMAMDERVKTGLRRAALENEIRAIRKKAKFWKALSELDRTPQKAAETWRENLRPSHSLSDIRKAVLKPPLCPDRDFENRESSIWETKKLSSEEVSVVDLTQMN